MNIYEADHQSTLIPLLSNTHQAMTFGLI